MDRLDNQTDCNLDADPYIPNGYGAQYYINQNVIDLLMTSEFEVAHRTLRLELFPVGQKLCY
jgi:hypothetical protein